MKRVLSIVLAMIMMMSLLAGCGGSDNSSNSNNNGNNSSSDNSGSNSGGGSSGGDAVKFGVFEPLTGANAAGGQLELQGIELANELFPEVLGRPIELVKVDNKSDQVEAANAAARLVENEGVDAVLGSWGSSLSIAGGDTFKNGETPAIGASPTSPNVTLGNDYYFRVCFMEDFMGKALAAYAGEGLKVTRGATIYEVTNDTNMGVRATLNDEFPKRGGEIVAEAVFSLGDQDFNSQIMSVMAENPEVIFIAGAYAEAALLIKQARGLGYDVPFLCIDTVDVPAFIEVGGADVEGVVYCTFFDAGAPITDMTTTFVDAYREKYGEEASALAALGFDAYMAAYYAIEKAGTTDGPAVRDALADLQYDGCTGPLQFDGNGDAVKDMIVLKTVQDGKAVYYDTYRF